MSALKDLLPEEHREASLAFLATSIVKANELAPERWALTLVENGDRVRLNVAQAQVISIRDGLLHTEVDEELAPADLVSQLTAEDRSSRWMKMEPRSLCLSLTPSELAENAGRLRPAHDQVIADLLRSKEGLSPFLRAHSPTLVDYISEALGEDLPQPGYLNGSDPWAVAIELCRGFLADRPAFDAEERTWKLEIAERARALIDAADAGDELSAPIRTLLANPPNHLLSWRVADVLRKWVTADQDAARAALRAIRPDAPAVERIGHFFDRLPPDVLPTPGARISVGAMLLMGLEPERLPMYRAEPFRVVEPILGWQAPESSAPASEQYESHRAFTEEFLSRLRSAGVDARDVLDAQSLIWMLHHREEAKAWRGGTSPVDEPEEEESPLGAEPADLQAVADRLYLDRSFLEEVIGLLEEKGQLVFYGPPGTGKTYIARELGRYLAGGDQQRFEIVQFHPSYSYEDFVQGYRPSPGADGALAYVLKPGPLVRLAARARAEPDARFVLLVDEINRGNLPRIFGELLFLLEYRDEAVRLMYSQDDGDRFSLPRNLLVIGTMNTADRSIGLIDAALRRRFHFKALFPAQPPIDGTLRRWLADRAPEMQGVATVVETLNQRLRDAFGDHLQVGPSYFMRDGLNDELLEQIWQVDILPFLEDQLFGREDELADFTLAALRAPGPAAEA